MTSATDKIIDLRSDTVTRPSAEMRAAIANAEAIQNAQDDGLGAGWSAHSNFLF